MCIRIYFLEGAFAVWEELEIKKLLGEKDSEIFCCHFGVKPNGNVDPAKDIQGELKNKVTICLFNCWFNCYFLYTIV